MLTRSIGGIANHSLSNSNRIDRKSYDSIRTLAYGLEPSFPVIVSDRFIVPRVA